MGQAINPAPPDRVRSWRIVPWGSRTLVSTVRCECWASLVPASTDSHQADLNRPVSQWTRQPKCVPAQWDRTELNAITSLFHTKLSYPLHVDLTSICWRSPAPGVIFHLLTPLFEHFVLLKNTCTRQEVISIQWLLMTEFFRIKQKNSGLFVLHSSLLN